MNENLLPKTPAIKDWLKQAVAKLSDAGIPSARLDAEIILSHTLNENRSFLHAHPENNIEAKQCEIADTRLDMRLDRVPIAYIIGYKEFYGRRFTVNEAVLIPRPESETIIDVLRKIIKEMPLSLFDENPLKLVDIGTGSGCLGVTAKLEFPELDVTLSDISPQALKVAEKNAQKLSADVMFIQSDLLQEYAINPDIIVANLPYVDKSWDRSPETEKEPVLALFADGRGRALIEKLIIQAENSIAPNGYMILEADPSQHDTLIKYAKKHSFDLHEQSDYVLSFKSNK